MVNNDDIVRLIMLLKKDISKCRTDILRLSRYIKSKEVVAEEIPVLEPPEIMITEEVYDKLCEFLDEDEMDKMGVT